MIPLSKHLSKALEDKKHNDCCEAKVNNVPILAGIQG